ncbi:putative baseplate assembly protein [Sphingomonas sp. DBB INV C78]|uniref:putative baseplate assembly protein n=1 Tax=Sphingomonas sp. DBB INV C78 TaxID=3349434 RepID=UPI0036D3C6C2
MIYRCCDEQRRLRVREHPTINGVDYVEVLDTEAPAGSPRQRTLLVRFVKAAPVLTVDNFEISGGERITDVGILWATPADAPDATLVTPAEAQYLADLPDPNEVIALRTDSSGDYSTYTLHLVASPMSLAPPPNIDPLLASVPFSFKVECPSDFDCAPRHICPDDDEPPVQINYLAKDYRSFRRLMLDRMAQTIPDWRERNAADLGVALVEMLAYVGDRLSYAQDAVATEAYIGTARRRSSVRRHARLVDYAMHDGTNARAWVQVQIFPGAPIDLVPGEARFLTRLPGVAPVVEPAVIAPPSGRLLLRNPVIFEPLHAKQLHAPLNEIFFHDWGDAECCLPKGAVRATLRGSFPMLAPGDVLIFEERIGPRTGSEADADPAKRWAVRLVQIVADIEDAVMDPPQPITEIRWADGDALPFAFCLSSRTEDGAVIRDVSHALGNILLVDHGLTHRDVDLGVVPEPHLHLATNGGDRCDPAPDEAVPPRFRPLLSDAPLTQAQRFTLPALADVDASATMAVVQDIRGVEPRIRLEASETSGPSDWEARRDLLGSHPDDPHFAVEVERDGTARLRFGDGRNGQRPASGTRFAATYRIGNGAAGNVGADAIAHIATTIGGIRAVRNPLPAAGGTPPESIEEARVAAPQAFRTQERAVTPEDYAAIALRHPAVQRAAATFRWNGHGHTVFVTVDRFGGRPITPAFEEELIAFLEPYRMAGYDLEIDEPRYVPIELAMLVCVKRDHFRPDVRLAVLEALSDRQLPDGRFGLFHPDNLTFDQDVWLSPIVARVQAIDGVESVTVTTFRRLDQPDPAPLETGILPIGRLEIAQLANDPDFPERGRLTLTMGGGK